MQFSVKLKYIKPVLIFYLAFLLCSCVSPRLTSVWTDPATVKNLNNILVISASKKDHNRRVNEDALVNELRKKGLNAKPGYQTLPQSQSSDIELLLEEVNAIYTDLDAVLFTDLPKIEEISYHHPASFRLVPYTYYSRYHGYHRTSYRHVYVPAHTTYHTIIEIGASLVDPVTGQLLWSAQSQTKDPSSMVKMMSKLGKKISKELTMAGFIQS